MWPGLPRVISSYLLQQKKSMSEETESGFQRFLNQIHEKGVCTNVCWTPHRFLIPVVPRSTEEPNDNILY